MKKEMISNDDKFRLIKFNDRYQINNFLYAFPTKLLVRLQKKITRWRRMQITSKSYIVLPRRWHSRLFPAANDLNRKQDVFVKAPDNGQFQMWPRSQGQISWYQYEDLVTRNAHVQYLSSNLSNLEVMTKVNFKEKIGQMSSPKV